MGVAFVNLIRLAGAGQLAVLVASALVPLRLNWRRDLAALPTLHRQLFWTYGGYVVLGIVALGGISLACAEELAAGSRLARAVCTLEECARRALEISLGPLALNNLDRARLLDIVLWSGDLTTELRRKLRGAALKIAGEESHGELVPDAVRNGRVD